MSSRIFEEAVADAKKLREVAEDNAKKAILEAVTPRIREFIESQLIEGDDSEEKEPSGDQEDSKAKKEEENSDGDSAKQEGLDEEVVLDESALMSLIKLVGGDEILEEFDLSSDADVIKESVSRTFKSLNESDRERIQQIASKFSKKADILENRNIDSNKGLNEENANMSNREKYYEVDLQSLREALDKESMKEKEYAEEDAHSDTEMEELMNEIRLILDLGEDIEADEIPEALRGMVEEDEEGEEVDLEDQAFEDEDMEMGAAEEDMDAMMAPEGEDSMGEPGSLDEVFEVDPRILRQELTRIKRHLREGKVEHHFGGKGGGKAGVDGAFGGKGKKNAGVKGAFGGGSEKGDAFTNPPQINKLNEAIRQLRRKNRAQSEKLNKYRGAINTLREQLEDLNLFNAKLLYVNKLLQNKTLTESQKKSVIKALDEANTLSETKTLYKSLTESLSSSRSTLNESARYGSSSRTTTSASSTSSQQATDLGRWQKLAGLK